MTRDRPSTWRRRLGKLTMSLVVFLLALLLVDRLLWFVTPGNQVQVVHAPQTDQVRRNLEFEVRFRTNSQGLRSAEIPLEKPADELRIVFAGDSYTEGHGVESAEAFPSLVKKRLSNDARAVNVINCGISGAGPLRYGRAAVCVGLRYHPDVCVLAVYPNDLTDTAAEDALQLARGSSGDYEVRSSHLKWQPGTPVRRAVSRLFPWTYSRLQRLKSDSRQRRLREADFVVQLRRRAEDRGVSGAEFDAAVARIPEAVLQACRQGRFNPELVAAACLRPDHHRQALDIPDERAEARWRTMRQLLSETAAICRRERVRPMLVYLPSPFQYDRTIGGVDRAVGAVIRSEWLHGQSELERRLETFCRDQKIAYKSLTDTFRKAVATSPGSLNFPLDSHWNAAGHAVAAAALATWIEAALE